MPVLENRTLFTLIFSSERYLSVSISRQKYLQEGMEHKKIWEYISA